MKTRRLASHLTGIFEIALFMRSGPSRFADTPEAARQSFLIPLLVFPLTICIALMFPKPAIQSLSAPVVVMLYASKSILCLALFIASVYGIAKQIDRDHHIYRFITAMNWLELATLAIMAPALCLAMAGINPLGHYQNYLIFALIYSYAFSAYMLTHVFRIPWEMGGFIAIVGLAINESGYDLMMWVGKALST